jgi:hypothetical protein
LGRLRLFYNRTLDLDEALLAYGWCGSLSRLAGQGQGIEEVKTSSSVKLSALILPLEDEEMKVDIQNILGGIATPPRSVWTLLREGIPCDDRLAKEAEALEDAVVLQELRIAADVEEAAPQDDGVEPSSESYDYVVSVTAKQRMCRLRKVGWCWRLPGIDYSKFKVLPGEPEAAHFDLGCKDCWRSGLRVDLRSGLGGGEPSPLLGATGLEVGLRVVLQDDLERDLNETSFSSSGDEESVRRVYEEDGAAASVAEKNADGKA